MDKDILFRFNPWWESGKISEELAKPFKRDLFYKVIEYLSKRQIIEIIGLRRVGKTTLLYQIIQKLLEKTEEKKILYFSFDEKSANIKEIIKTYEVEVLNKKIEDSGQIY
ncbi:MAG: AAA family ATPase, partial [Candidatus Aenigmatarchaeota archaeon]